MRRPARRRRRRADATDGRRRSAPQPGPAHDRRSGHARRHDPPARSVDRRARCRTIRSSAASTATDERIVAYGLRNPFRITARPGTNEIWIGDVGWNVWEEINRSVDPTDAEVENFGWPCYEGAGRQPGYDGANLNICETAVRAARRRHRALLHLQPQREGRRRRDTCATGSSSVAGLAFYQRRHAIRRATDDALFFADYSRNCIWVMLAGANGIPTRPRAPRSDTARQVPVDLKIGPGRRSLLRRHLRRHRSGGSRYFSGNLPPVAAAQAAPDVGTEPAPRARSTDSGRATPTATPSTYAWDLDGDGDFDDSTATATRHLHLHDGRGQDRARAGHRTAPACPMWLPLRSS